MTDIKASATAATTRSNAGIAAATIALGVLALGVWLRLAGLGAGGLWLDEVFSASFANLPALGTMMGALIIDVHPPLYYLQLHFWGLLGHGDYWLLLNSVFWSTLTLLAVFRGTQRQFGIAAALAALSLCAVMGSEIFYSHELRMYSLYSCLSVLSWIAADRLHQDYRFLGAIPLIAVLAALGAVHSGSVIGASAAMFYAFPRGSREQIKARLRTWMIVGIVVAFSYVPWVISAGTRRIAHARGPSVAALSHTVGGWLIGYGDVLLPPWANTAASILAALALIGSLLLAPRLMRIAACFILWPMVFGALLCVLVQPIWLDRTFAFCAPFLAITFGATFADLLSPVRLAGRTRFSLPATLLLAALVSAGGTLSYLQAVTPYKPESYREAAGYLATHVQSGDIIYATEGPTLWGLARYLVGPDWGSIFEVQDPPDLYRIKRWTRLNAALGAGTIRRLGLMPIAPRFDGFRVPMYTGTPPAPSAAHDGDVWLVARSDEPKPTAVLACNGSDTSPAEFGRLRIYRVECRKPT
jgi:mannosyltransferase